MADSIRSPGILVGKTDHNVGGLTCILGLTNPHNQLIPTIVCAMCSRSDAQMSEIVRHQSAMHGRMDGPYRQPTAVGAQSHTCKGSSIKHVVHQVPVGLQRSRIMVTWAVPPNGGSGLQPCSHPILPLMTQQDRAVRGGSLPSTWQQQKTVALGKKKHAPSSPGEDSEMVQATAHSPRAGGLGGPGQGRLVLANQAGTHGPTHLMLPASSSMTSNSQPSQALLHRILLHEEHDAAHNELGVLLAGRTPYQK